MAETIVAALDERAVNEFAARQSGLVLRRGDPGYDEVRRIWNGAFDRHPALIARCTGVADVVGAVRFAREQGLVAAVRGGGHSIAGHSTCDDGIVIDLSPMRGIWVDPRARTARAQGGATWGLLDRETQQFALAVTGGQITHTGIAGLTLGGGIGWLVRKLGLSCDSLVSADVVTADGECVSASADENPDLFWGLRGGGGNFGIATSFEYRLHPLGVVLGGITMYPAEQARDVLRFYRKFTAGAPDELTSYAVFLTAPPAPFVPAELQAQPAIALAVCYAGDVEDGETVVRPLREFGPPAADLVQPMPYTVLQGMFDESAIPGRPAYITGDYVGELEDRTVDLLVELAAGMPGPHCQIHVGHLGGAVRRVAEDETAFSHRDAENIVIGIAIWDDPAEAESHVAWAKTIRKTLSPVATGTYVNFLADEGKDRVRFSYGDEKLERLVELKRKYDPDNFFRLNQNIAL